jgi:FixJ family two-component response regulator
VTALATDRPIIHLVDDDEAVLRALKRLLNAAGYRCATHISAEEFLTSRDIDAPGCAIVDLCLPGADGLHLQSRLAESEANFPVIFLTGKGDIKTGIHAMKCGAVDFLTKPVESKALFAAIARAIELEVAARADRLDRESFNHRLDKLTPREREVLDGVVAGRLNKQIAADLGIAEKTIKVHRSRVMQKMNARTIADLVRLVVKHRI